MSSRPRLLIPLLFVCLAVGLAADASAHAYLVSSSPGANAILPTAPTTVRVTVSEAIVASVNTWIRVTDYSSGARVDNGSATISPTDRTTMTVPLRPIGGGTYAVAWGAEDAIDGHSTAGGFYFEVQNADGSLVCCLPSGSVSSGGAPVSPIEIVLRFATFVGLTTSFGVLVLAWFVWIPATWEFDRAEEVPRGALRALFLWGRVGASIFTIAVAGQWGLLWTSSSPGSALNVLGSPFAASLVARVALGLILLGAFAVLVRRAGDYEKQGDRPTALFAALLLGCAAIVAGSPGTHGAAASDWAPVGLIADAAHVTGVSVWVGSLLVLFLLRAWFFRTEAIAFSGEVLGRFSGLAFYAVGLVLLAGVVLSIILVGSIDALVGTVFGWVVLAKIALFAPMVTLGALNRYRVLPSVSPVTNEAPAAVRALRRNVRWEATLGTVVLGLAAVLTSLGPTAAPAASGPQFPIRAFVGDVRVDFIVFPAPTVPGNYTFTFELWNATSSAPFSNTASGYVNFTNLGSQITQKVVLDGPHGNHYFIDTDALNARATWKIAAVFARGGGLMLNATFYLQI